MNSTRNTFEGNNSNNNNNPVSNSRSGTKSVNLMNNMYDPGQGSFNNINENNQVSSDNSKAFISNYSLAHNYVTQNHHSSINFKFTLNRKK